MDLIRKETLKNILIAIQSQPVVGYIRKFLSIYTSQEKMYAIFSDVAGV